MPARQVGDLAGHRAQVVVAILVVARAAAAVLILLDHLFAVPPRAGEGPPVDLVHERRHDVVRLSRDGIVLHQLAVDLDGEVQARHGYQLEVTPLDRRLSPLLTPRGPTGISPPPVAACAGPAPPSPVVAIVLDEDVSDVTVDVGQGDAHGVSIVMEMIDDVVHPRGDALPPRPDGGGGGRPAGGGGRRRPDPVVA